MSINGLKVKDKTEQNLLAQYDQCASKFCLTETVLEEQNCFLIHLRDLGTLSEKRVYVVFFPKRTDI